MRDAHVTHISSALALSWAAQRPALQATGALRLLWPAQLLKAAAALPTTASHGYHTHTPSIPDSFACCRCWAVQRLAPRKPQMRCACWPLPGWRGAARLHTWHMLASQHCHRLRPCEGRQWHLRCSLPCLRCGTWLSRRPLQDCTPAQRAQVGIATLAKAQAMRTMPVALVLLAALPEVRHTFESSTGMQM